MPKVRQAVVTVASGGHAGRLDRTFTTFAQNSYLELHAFVIGDQLPDRRVEGIQYHLEPPDPSFGDEMRDLYYRRLLFIEKIDAQFVLLVDNSDVLCMQVLPELSVLLRGAALGACVEHAGSRYLQGQGYTSSYFNAGVTFWDVPASRQIRRDIVERGAARFRSVEDQLTLNEVVHTKYCQDVVILPSQFNYRACLSPFKLRGWPTVAHLDGVFIYHNVHCVRAAKTLIPVKHSAQLPELPKDEIPLGKWQKRWRRFRSRLEPHYVK